MAHEELDVRIFSDAVITPGVGVVVDGKVDVESSDRKQRPPANASTLSSEPSRIGSSAIFAGPLFGHFGHFLVESLSRAWYFAVRPELPIAWSCQTQRNAYVPYQREVLKLLQVKNDPIFVTRPTLSAELHVPESGFDVGERLDPALARALGVYSGGSPEKGYKLWLSRSGLGDGRGGVTNETVVEEILRRRGWHIYHPEQHPLMDQLAELSRADCIAGVEGSAFHLLMLIKRPQARVTIVSRRSRAHRNFEVIARAVGFAQQVITVAHVEVDPEQRRALRRVTWIAPEAVPDAIEAAW
jgi:capsular polysaccharide biosynthesis protein